MENQLISIVNKQVANWSVLYVKLHNYHWYVKGNQFFTLHIKFEELYNEAALHIDELAERLLSIGGKPIATMKGYIEKSSVKEARGDENAEQMVSEISKDFSILIDELKLGMSIAEAENDNITGDMLLAIHSSLEKHVWMLNSFLGQ